MLKGLVQLYGNEQCSTFKKEENVAAPLFTFSGDVDSSINYFLLDFELYLTQLKKEQNKKISIMIKENKLMSNEIDSYRHHHSILSSDVYSQMYVNSDQYLEIMKLFKLSLLITPSAANVESGFSAVNLIHTKQRNHLAVQSLERLLHINLVGPKVLDEELYVTLADNYKNAQARQI